jgi:hypothetical protein
LKYEGKEHKHNGEHKSEGGHDKAMGRRESKEKVNFHGCSLREVESKACFTNIKKQCTITEKTRENIIFDCVCNNR